MQPTKKVNPLIIALIVIVLVGVAVAAAAITKQPEENNSTETTQNENTTEDQAASPDVTDEAINYKDGTYTEKGRYISPGGAESIDVTVTLVDDIITSAAVTSNATRGESKDHQEDFISGFKTLVEGKDIDTVSLSRVAGSSLTPNGFNAALKLIKVDAGV